MLNPYNVDWLIPIALVDFQYFNLVVHSLPTHHSYHANEHAMPLCMVGNNRLYDFVTSSDIFQNILFSKRSLSSPNWFQTGCKDRPQTTLVGTELTWGKQYGFADFQRKRAACSPTN